MPLWNSLQSGDKAIDSVEIGVKVPEADPESLCLLDMEAWPDRDGQSNTWTLALWMRQGIVGRLVFYKISNTQFLLHRKVMEETPHVMLSGKGAHYNLHLEQGFD